MIVAIGLLGDDLCSLVQCGQRARKEESCGERQACKLCGDGGGHVFVPVFDEEKVAARRLGGSDGGHVMMLGPLFAERRRSRVPVANSKFWGRILTSADNRQQALGRYVEIDADDSATAVCKVWKVSGLYRESSGNSGNGHSAIFSRPPSTG